MAFVDFPSIGLMTSIGSFQKTAKLKAKWQVKKETDLTGRYDGLTEFQRKNAMFKDSYKEHQLNNEQDTTLSKIRDKIYAGNKLTAAEMQYLQSKDPMLYQKMKNIELEAKKYEEELKHCKTKEEVEKLKISKVNSSLMTIKNVENNPHIPEGVKLQIAQQEQRRLQELEKVMMKFVKSGEFASLPTEAEKQMAEEALKEAQREELGIENNEDIKNEAENSADTVDEAVEHNTAEASESTITENTQKAEISQENKVHKSFKGDKKTASELGDGKRTVEEVEISPEFKKAKHKKVAAAYSNVASFFSGAEIVEK